MAEATIKWLEERRFVGIDSTEHGIVIATPQVGGRIGVKPSDLLLMSLGSCISHDVVGILQKKRQHMTGLEVRVSGEQEADPPWTFTRFHVHFVVSGRDLNEKAVCDAIELADRKYCSISATLKQGAAVTHSYEIVEAG